MLGVTTEVNKALFIVNKFSGTGYKARLEGRILEAMQAYDSTCVLEFTRARGHATSLASKAIEDGFDCVVAVGGDGTINEVAQSLVGTKVRMGIVPRGSGNGLARHLGIPLDVGQATHTVFTGKPIDMDTFTVNGKLSLNVSGIGFDGRVANEFGKDGKRGLLNYIRISLREYSGFSPFTATVLHDGKQLVRKSFIIAIANSSQYGNNARIAPHASVCDGKIHLSLIDRVPAYRIDWIVRLFRGTLQPSEYCEMLDVQELTIDLNEAVAYHVDGEPCGEGKHFAIHTQPASLRVIAPTHAGRRI